MPTKRKKTKKKEKNIATVSKKATLNTNSTEIKFVSLSHRPARFVIKKIIELFAQPFH